MTGVLNDFPSGGEEGRQEEPALGTSMEEDQGMVEHRGVEPRGGMRDEQRCRKGEWEVDRRYPDGERKVNGMRRKDTGGMEKE